MGLFVRKSRAAKEANMTDTPSPQPHEAAARPPLRMLRDFLFIPVILAVLCGLFLAAVDQEIGHIPAALWLTFAIPAGIAAVAIFNWLTWETEERNS